MISDPVRDQALVPFVGNASALRLLRATTASGKAPHAWLFIGPPQVGKSTLARWLAMALLCERRLPGDAEPCGECRACLRVSHGTHPDAQTFSLARQAEASDRAAASRELSIDTVRAIVGEIDLLPYQGDRKVYVIEDADTLTEEAANALLKTLEEPPSYATLVLVGVDERALPQTIRSRCTLLRLGAVSTQEVLAMLRSRAGGEPAATDRIAEVAAGRPGWALRAADDPTLLEQHDANVATLTEALRGGAVTRLALAERMGKRWTAGHRSEVYAALFDWLGYWRQVMRAASGQGGPLPGDPNGAEVERSAQRGVTSAARAAERTVEAIAHLDANVNTRMAVETLLLELR